MEIPGGSRFGGSAAVARPAGRPQAPEFVGDLEPELSQQRVLSGYLARSHGEVGFRDDALPDQLKKPLSSGRNHQPHGVAPVEFEEQYFNRFERAY